MGSFSEDHRKAIQLIRDGDREGTVNACCDLGLAAAAFGEMETVTFYHAIVTAIRKGMPQIRILFALEAALPVIEIIERQKRAGAPEDPRAD